MPRKVKIICTLGPSSSSEEKIERLIDAGMNIARLNFSHGDHDFFRTLINRIRHVSVRLKRPVAILQDLQGPKVRVAKLKNDEVFLKDKSEVVITNEDIIGDETKFSSTYKEIVKDVSINDTVLLDDGKLVLRCIDKSENQLICKVLQGGILKSNKGINLPQSNISASSLTNKDIKDLYFGARAGVDAVALSFVRSSKDIIRLRAELASTKTRPVILAKLEKQQAIDDLESILNVSDGVMVARGDLGVEIPPENVPLIQKRIIEQALAYGRSVVVATEMLESMTNQIRPTRAEASDVANAVLDGADMLMLSAETASGQFPLESVSMMNKIVRHVEESRRASYWRTKELVLHSDFREVQNNLCLGAVNTCETLKAAAIVMYTNSGRTARLVSAYRPEKPIIAFVPNSEIERKLAFNWGVRTLILPPKKGTSALIASINEKLLSLNEFEIGDKIIILTKIPLISKGHTNTIHIHTLKPAISLSP